MFFFVDDSAKKEHKIHFFSFSASFFVTNFKVSGKYPLLNQSIFISSKKFFFNVPKNHRIFGLIYICKT